jgi:hypothetical protein
VIAKFLKMAAANLWRYGTRTGLTAAGLALAIAAVLFVNVVALSFESGASSVHSYIRSTRAGVGNVWVTPPKGFQLDPQTGFFAAPGTLPESLADRILSQNQSGVKVLTGHLPGSYDPPIVVYGCSECKTIALSRVAAETLSVKPGESIATQPIPVKVDAIDQVLDLGSGGVIEMPLAIAQQLLVAPQQVSWVMLHTKDLTPLRQFLTDQANAQVTTDPTMVDSTRAAIAYVLDQKLSRADLVTFDVKLSALYFNQATSSLLGWLARISLGLGFVLMLSAALLSIEERRREFGIYAAVGVSSDVFYLFFLESLLLFVGSTAIGLMLGAGLLWILTPALFDWSVILKSSVLVACYLPPMVIFGSLIPAQRLLQKTPLELLRSAT